MSDKDTLLAIYTYRMGIHTALTHCIATHFFLFSLPFPQRNTESGQGFGVWSYLCRLKREKTLFASLTLTGQMIPCSDMIFLRIDTLTVEKSDLS